MSDKPRSYKPISGNDLPRFAGIATFIRLPYIAPGDADGVDIDDTLVRVDKSYPEDCHSVSIDDAEFEAFLNSLR